MKKSYLDLIKDMPLSWLKKELEKLKDELRLKRWVKYNEHTSASKEAKRKLNNKIAQVEDTISMKG